MDYIRSQAYQNETFLSRIMGPNPIKLLEELLRDHEIPAGAAVMDLGSGQGVTSLFLAREYGVRVWAADLWSDPAENQTFFDRMGMPREQLVPVKADACDLPFEREFFDAVVSIDAYHYFGRDPAFLEEKLLPFVKPGGRLYFAVPGMKRDCHDHIPPELLLSWEPEQLDSIHDANWWRGVLAQTAGAEILSVREMESNEEVWADWLARDNEYAAGDRKIMEAGGGKYLNFVAMVLRKR